MTGLSIFIKDTPPSKDYNKNYFVDGECNHLRGMAKGGAYVFPCIGSGYYVVVYIRLEKPTLLHLCEIEVYGQYFLLNFQNVVRNFLGCCIWHTLHRLLRHSYPYAKTALY